MDFPDHRQIEHTIDDQNAGKQNDNSNYAINDNILSIYGERIKECFGRIDIFTLNPGIAADQVHGFLTLLRMHRSGAIQLCVYLIRKVF